MNVTLSSQTPLYFCYKNFVKFLIFTLFSFFFVIHSVKVNEIRCIVGLSVLITILKDSQVSWTNFFFLLCILFFGLSINFTKGKNYLSGKSLDRPS